MVIARKAKRQGKAGAPMANTRSMASTAKVSPMFYNKGERFALAKADLERLVHKTDHRSQS